jgi:hypothetical protein
MKSALLTHPQAEGIFVDEFSDLSWSALLSYFQNRTHVKYFPLSKGKAKHLVSADQVLANEFDFNNEQFNLGEDFDWTINPSKDLEWLILLHKFYYLKDLAGAYDVSKDERYAEKWVSLIESWINQVPDGFIDSQVTGRRLQQWILSYHTFVTEKQSPTVTPDFFECFINSINSQTHYLCLHLTPEGNHRTLELYAIFLVAVSFPELKSADWFLEFSTQKLLENMQQDLLADGVHRELSTDYHHTVLKNYLRFRGLALLNEIALPAACDTLLQKAIEFSYYAHKPDGFIPAINDGDCISYLPLLIKANGYYPNEHLQYVITQGEEGEPPLLRSRGFKESGYTILRSDWAAKPYSDALYLFFDCAPLGFGSHGHYDALNFEMAAYGCSLIVDPGRYTYSEFSEDKINWRKYFKETAAHNTVVVDGLSQMPYRGGRPVDPEPEATLKQFVTAEGFDYLHGQVISHQYTVKHERMIFFLQPEYWIVTDLLTAEGKHNYDLYFHLSEKAQGLTNLATDDVRHVIGSPNLLMIQPISSDTDLTVEQGYVSPEYGIKYEAPIIKFTKSQASETTFNTVLYPFKDKAPTVQVTQLSVYQKNCLCQSHVASALKICVTREDSYFEDIFFINHSANEAECTFSDITCSGQLLFVRRDELGNIINLQCEGLSSLKVKYTDLLIQQTGKLRLSYQVQHLCLSTENKEQSVSISSIDALLDWDGINLVGIKSCLK